MKHILPFLLLLIAIPTQAEIISRNLVGTAADIRITQDYQEDTDTGELAVKLCPSCNSYTLATTSKTKVFKEKTELDLVMLKTYLNENRSAPMRLQFNKKNLQVISIILQRNNKEHLL